jgi:hypothetical protein
MSDRSKPDVDTLGHRGRTTRTGTPPLAPHVGDRPAQEVADLPMPHERDESHGATDRTPDPVIEQARRDIVSGQVDTDMRATPGLDAARRDALVGTPQPQRNVGPDTKADAPAADRLNAHHKPG